MSKLKKARKLWRRLPNKTKRQIKRKARKAVGREKNSEK